MIPISHMVIADIVHQKHHALMICHSMYTRTKDISEPVSIEIFISNIHKCAFEMPAMRKMDISRITA